MIKGDCSDYGGYQPSLGKSSEIMPYYNKNRQDGYEYLQAQSNKLSSHYQAVPFNEEMNIIDPSTNMSVNLQ